jgi:5-amino-6-(5-phosphoribosylamino)uracil reductase
MLTVAEAVEALTFGDWAPGDRPYLVLNMISSADGKAALAGRTNALGGPADRELFHALRAQVDAVMVGAGTLRQERYGRLVRDPALREIRRRRGLDPEPVALIVSRSLELPLDSALLADPAARVIVLTNSDQELSGCAAQVEYLRPEREGELELGAMLGSLRERWGVRSVLCEGGPQLNSALLPLGIVDELFLSIAPKLIGGLDAMTIVAGMVLPHPIEMRLRWLLESEGYLFARYALQDANWTDVP